MQSSSTLKYTPSYESLVDAVNRLSERLEKATSTNKTLRNDLKVTLAKNAKLEKFIRAQNALLQEHGLAEYGN
jgi:mevalonate kinase